MASNNITTGQGGNVTRSSFSSIPGANTSLLLERTKIGVRRSTPDSEVLASSDDEQDHHHQAHATSAGLVVKQTRRPSWLNEIQPFPQRKASFAGSTSYSPGNSNPTTPSGDQSSWGNTAQSGTSNIGRGHSNSTSFPWTSGIWNTDMRKEPPSRLSEVLPSPTSVVAPAPYGDESLTSPIIGREQPTESTIPFAIPLHPTPKTYRSQSYSVGQLDPESLTGMPNNLSYSARLRSGQPGGLNHSGLHHRPSRPSMLSEVTHEGGGLGELHEVEDDEDDQSTNGSDQGVKLFTQARTTEDLAKENKALRQQAANKIETVRQRNRATSAASSGHSGSNTHYSHPIHDAVPEEAEYAIAEFDELNHPQGYPRYASTGRRYSEYGAGSEARLSTLQTVENRKLESVKKGHWQSSLGFGGLAEGSQSRRHSFADVSARNGSVSFGTDTYSALASGGDLGNGRVSDMQTDRYSDSVAGSNHFDNGEYAHFRSRYTLEEEALELEHLRSRNYAASYFSGEIPPTAAQSASIHDAYDTLGRSHSPMPLSLRNPYLGLQQQLPIQSLYIVLFKSCRCDVFYIQEGTGLQVTKGDLVIVEADRGTDLGTIEVGNVSWSKARGLKEHYAEEHYKWLMIFSRQGQAGNPHAINPNGMLAANGGNSAVGGMGPPGQHSNQEAASGELKPKMIKRLAQHHEISTLKDKEANEAKAKRVGQQKVVEHRLNMEILDAEFQMDWKKLTFYYFADSYINFNSLVTDLFKVYKTRIWMSAINPASFMTPTAGLQLPSGIGPGALSVRRDSPIDRRQHYDQQPYGGLRSQRSYQGTFVQPTEHGRDSSTPHNNTFHNPYAAPFQPASQLSRGTPVTMGEYSQPFPQQFATHQSFNPLSYGYREQFLPAAQPNGHDPRRAHPTGTEWMNTFQGLSLGSQ
ncbi:MAG: hypothetical protein M1812_004208 [Candelaria pacifica]|nr:MAG: hypothetical protein M1812_004208 [Candelaria pacifica]